MGAFKDYPSKKVIREKWCEPLIKFIHDELGHKLLYLGLPSSQAIDLLTWIEHIDKVIAFQCRAYPKPSSISQPKTEVQELEKKLRELEREGKISTFALYDGYIEEVILKGKDTNGDHFNQNDVVTIYNLDFCNGITVPLTVVDEKGNSRNFYKSEVIRKLLEIQRDASLESRSKKFVMFLTIRSGFWFEEEEKFISQTQDSDIKKYISTLNKLDARSKKLKLLKVYMYQILKNFFCNCNFTPELLPVIYYKGFGEKKNNWLMHFTIMGSLNKQISGIAPSLQNSQDFLNQKFFTIENDKFAMLEFDKTKEVNCPTNLVEAFKNSECYKQLWSKKEVK